ncbi:MAG TPA: ornithine--oxo-acid transaminase [Dermatophilaceae bacterium]|jgi:ornithine--oxo-acid transaminase|nr:ornithine--oxo-acid transaminase [Dermatophilaceae bacterium]OPZ54989.1 MAG: Ornithine aminotransferase [bacterium ADurb.BinA028]HOA56762.1 ornithine--oxo-acid transaminase [Dermatophilaceae bacterium]HOF35983.1 ornithine--oxo-acid transaminase [Dermatophilaceae bacterium]HOR15712.1 ornithine--oxo-acid transaminase [Dermatophilaceae bacterium]
MTNAPSSSADFIELEHRFAAHNYSPLDVVIARGEGAWVEDVEGRRYFDALAGYSALNFGHSNPRLIEVAERQLRTLTLTSRAFHSDQLGPFARDLCALTGKDLILPMNSGAEAVETAIKVTRRWGKRTKGLPEDWGTIIVMGGNFHGRTTTIVSFSTDKVAREDYGPYTPGFLVVPYGDIDALRAAMTDETIGVLLEPIQGEGGVVIPPEGFLREVRALCTERNVLMVADEIQSGLARTGRTFACDHEDVVPDIYILGKALGGGIVPLSAIAANRDVLSVITPGSHGSTFGGNPFAAAIGREVIAMLQTGEFQERARLLGDLLAGELAALNHPGIVEVRLRGLWAGIDVDPALMSGKELCHRMADRGVLAKDTHGSTIRLAPPLVATEADIRMLVSVIADALNA